MLVMTRKVGESIVINDNITVTILQSTGFSVRVGVTAPKDVPVHREEIKAKIDEQNQERKD